MVMMLPAGWRRRRSADRPVTADRRASRCCPTQWHFFSNISLVLPRSSLSLVNNSCSVRPDSGRQVAITVHLYIKLFNTNCSINESHCYKQRRRSALPHNIYVTLSAMSHRRKLYINIGLHVTTPSFMFL